MHTLETLETTSAKHRWSDTPECCSARSANPDPRNRQTHRLGEGLAVLLLVRLQQFLSNTHTDQSGNQLPCGGGGGRVMTSIKHTHTHTHTHTQPSISLTHTHALPPPPTFNSLHSLESEKAGNISSYFSTAICDGKQRRYTWMHLSLSLSLMSHGGRGVTSEEGGVHTGAGLTLALSSSTMKWHSEALKKYSLALYLSRGLSMVLAPTCRGGGGVHVNV